MKTTMLVLALLTTSAGLASAQGVDVDVNRGGAYGSQSDVQVAPADRAYNHDRLRHRETTGLGANCHVIVRHIFRNGERITEHHRICD